MSIEPHILHNTNEIIKCIVEFEINIIFLIKIPIYQYHSIKFMFFLIETVFEKKISHKTNVIAISICFEIFVYIDKKGEDSQII